MSAVVVGPDGLARCPWATSVAVLTDYHDREWGVPVHGERALFERIVLEGFQSGLSWLTVLNKRPAFRAAFYDFDPDVVAALGDDYLDTLMTNPGIIRNRTKIHAARTNAQAVIALRDGGGLDEFVWSRRPGPAEAPTHLADLPSQSPESVVLADDLRRHGFRFVGPTTAYALMQAVGLIDAHLVGCHRRGVHSSPDG